MHPFVKTQNQAASTPFSDRLTLFLAVLTGLFCCLAGCQVVSVPVPELPMEPIEAVSIDLKPQLKIKIAPLPLLIPVGERVNLLASVVGIPSFQWQVSDPQIASVEGNQLIARQAGTVTLKAISKGVFDEVVLMIVSREPAFTPSLNPSRQGRDIQTSPISVQTPESGVSTTPTPFIIPQPALTETFTQDTQEGFSDGPLASAQFNQPLGLSADTQGNLFVADVFNHRIRKIDPQQSVSTLAGDGTPGSLDGKPGQFNQPWATAVDQTGAVYVADSHFNQIVTFRL